MKIRQKIAMLLAAAMTLTAVPMVTMAQSDTKVVSGVVIGKKDEGVSNQLRIEMKDTTDQPFMFFVKLTNAEFKSAASGTSVKFVDNDPKTSAITYSNSKDGKEMRVLVSPTAADTGMPKFYIPLDVVLKGGDATVEVISEGSTLSDFSSTVFARTSDSKASVTVGDAKPIYTDYNKVAKITIEEPFRDVLLKDSEKIKFAIRHSDYDFTGKVTVKTEKGFEFADGTSSKDFTTFDSTYFVTDSKDDSVVEFKTSMIKYLTSATNPTGRLTFEFELDATSKTPSTGALNMRVTGTNVSDTTVKVGEVNKYGTIIKMEDEKVIDVVAGHNKEITFTVKEAVSKSFGENREFDIELDQAFLSAIDDMNKSQEKALVAELDSKLTFDKGTAEVVAVLKDEDDFVNGFTVKVISINAADKDSQLEFEFEDILTFVPLGYSGDVKIVASGRALVEEASVVAINAKKAVEVTTEPITVKVGLKEQQGGKIVIKETDKGIFEQGEYFFIALEENSGLTFKDEDFSKNGKIEVTSGDLELDLKATKIDEKNSVLAVLVKRASDTASTITIKDLTVYSDRTVPQGTYDFDLGGRALAQAWTLEKNVNDDATEKLSESYEAEKGKIARKDDVSMIKPIGVKAFINVATPNTEDITANGLKKGVSSFVIGSSKYVTNGVEAEMDGAVYLDNGRTMVPVRYVANALGVPATDIFFASGTATILAGSKTVSLTVGDKVAKLNGVAARTMVSAPVVKDGRTYVPVAEIGSLLGVEATWDSATQTATFTNK
jgi:hypothetical protein